MIDGGENGVMDNSATSAVVKQSTRVKRLQRQYVAIARVSLVDAVAASVENRLAFGIWYRRASGVETLRKMCTCRKLGSVTICCGTGSIVLLPRSCTASSSRTSLYVM